MRGERGARRLLAVAQGGVEDGDFSHLAAPTGSRAFAGAACCGTSRLGSHGIISRSLRPTRSIGRVFSLARCAERVGAALRCSGLPFFAGVPALLSPRALFLSSRPPPAVIR